MDDQSAAKMTKAKYLLGRWKIGEERRRLRYEAGLDICLAAVTILKEFVADCESEYFACIHDHDLAEARRLIAEAERIEQDDDPTKAASPQWKDWLVEVATIVPLLWD